MLHLTVQLISDQFERIDVAKEFLERSGECKNNEDKDKADYGGVRRIIIMYSERRLYLVTE
ncbi:hypothetical protein YC2023_068997 [Brassica napus]